MASEGPRHIFEAVQNDNQTAIEVFIEKKYVSLKNHDASYQTVAHIAAKRDNLSILKYLLDKDKYLLTARDGDNFTILQRAAEFGGLTVVKYLIEEYKMDPYETVDKKFGNTALHVAALGGQLDVVKYFIEEKGMDANLKNAVQQSPAFMSAFNKHLSVIQYLIECHKVDTTGVDHKNENILFPLVRKADIQSVKYLLDDRKVNLDVNWRGENGRTLLHWATKMKQTDLLSYLVEEKNADINIKDDDGWTALHVAADAGNLRATKYLIEHKANFRIKNAEGKKPVEICKHFKTKNYLEGSAQYRGPTRRRFSRNAFHLFSSAEQFSVLVLPQLATRSNEQLEQSKQLAINQKKDNFISESINNVDCIQLDTFLVVVRVILWLFGNNQRKKHLSSQHQNQIDLTARAVQNAHVNLKD